MHRLGKFREVGVWLTVILAGLLVAVPNAPAHAAAGDLDRSFDRDGKRTVRFEHGKGGKLGTYATIVLRQPDGKLVLLGGYESEDSSVRRTVLARLTWDGRLDHSFGRGGRVVADPTGRDLTVKAGALQPDGKIVVLSRSVSENHPYGFYALVRLTANGRLDRSFGGGDGVVLGELGDEGLGASDVAITGARDDPKIVVAGAGGWDAPFQIELARYDADGDLDTSFGGGDGRVTTPTGQVSPYGDYDEVRLAVGRDGALTAATNLVAHESSGRPGVLLARYEPDGALDATFGGGAGTVFDPVLLAPLTARMTDVIALRDGGVGLAGYAYRTGRRGYTFLVARYLSDGGRDKGFGANGIRLVRFRRGGMAFSLAVQRDGKLVLAGGCGHFCLARVSARGELDRAFGVGDGKVVTSFAKGGSARSVLVDPRGGIVAAGGADGDFAVARYLSR